MRRNTMLILLAVSVILILGVLLRLMPRGKAPVHLAAENCDPSLWKHVYLPDRLPVIDPCVAVEGRVDEVRHESDGDIHILVDVDQQRALNVFNRLHAKGDLIVELICEDTPKEGEAATACAGFTPRATIPSPGERVRIIGSFVTDGHNRWNEIHPVTKMEVLK